MQNQSQEKFSRVAESYTDKYYFAPYYQKLVTLLEKYLGNGEMVLDIGSADGITEFLWSRYRNEHHKANKLTVYSVEPVKEMVTIAEERAKIMNFSYIPLIGDIEGILSEKVFTTKHFNGIFMSRSLHEIFLNHERNFEEVFGILTRILLEKKIHYFIIGLVNKYTKLTQEETKRFIEEQAKIIGHGHNPATDYIDQSQLIKALKEIGFTVIETTSCTQPLAGFDPSPWGETIFVFEKTNNPDV